MPLFKKKSCESVKLPYKAVTIKLPDGLKGNEKTIEIMSQWAHARKTHPFIRQFVEGILRHSKTDSHHYLDESYSIGNFVQKKVRYLKDAYNSEQLKDPLLMTEEIYCSGHSAGDCDDMSLLIATYLLAIGHKPSFRAVRYQGDNKDAYNHIYVVDYEMNPGMSGRSRIVIDAIMKDRPIGSEVKHLSGQEYSLSKMKKGW